MAIHFDASPFIRAHGKQPGGRGSWAFADKPNPQHDDTTLVFSPSMTLTQAKSWMRKELRSKFNVERGEDVKVYILS